MRASTRLVRWVLAAATVGAVLFESVPAAGRVYSAQAGGGGVAISARLSAQQVATITLPAPGSTKTLYEGCNNIALTFPNRTPVGHPHPGWTTESVVEAIEPSSALQSIWRYDAAQNRFQGFSSAAPQAGDLLTVNFLDAVWVCVTALAVAPTPAPTNIPQPGAFSVHFIDVSQGDAIPVEAGDADILKVGNPAIGVRRADPRVKTLRLRLRLLLQS